MTVGNALEYAADRLNGAGIEDARGEARILVGHVLKVPPPAVALDPGRGLDADQRDRLDVALDARCARRPMAQVIGRREFWSLEFIVTGDTLDPRPDTETLVEAALEALPEAERAVRVLDLGTGTGCLLLAFLSERPQATGLGVDIDPDAIAVARRNADALGLGARARFVTASWLDAVDAQFDLILANPPYIPAGDIDALQPEVAIHEPRRALDGGADGLNCYRAIAADLARVMAPDGIAIVEIGAGQAESAIAILGKEGLEIDAIRRDLAGVERCLTLRKS